MRVTLLQTVPHNATLLHTVPHNATLLRTVPHNATLLTVAKVAWKILLSKWSPWASVISKATTSDSTTVQWVGSTTWHQSASYKTQQMVLGGLGSVSLLVYTSPAEIWLLLMRRERRIFIKHEVNYPLVSPPFFSPWWSVLMLEYSRIFQSHARILEWEAC